MVTVASMFLCASVVTYVATAGNYRQQYKDLKGDRDSLSKRATDLTGQINKKIEENQKLNTRLSSEIATLNTSLNKLQGELRNVQREKASLDQKVQSWVSITQNLTETTDKQRQQFEKTLTELNTAKAQQVKERKELNETTASLIEKMAIIETLDAKNKRLLEERTELQDRLDKILWPRGEQAAAPAPVTPEKHEPAQPVRQPRFITRDISLQGLVTGVDMKHSMASISIGAADGVREGMLLHVTRGENFICDIKVIDVDTEEAVGVLQLVQQPPRIGDNVSTNL